MNGKTIRIYLVDGAPAGILTAEIINWTGKIIVAPRSQLANLAERDEVKRTGIYCLIGPDPENPTRDIVYIGEGDNLFSRLTTHHKDESKDFWTRCGVVISKDQNLTKAHGRYLESRLISLGQLAGRALIINGTAPPLPPLPEPDIADMEFFLDQLQMVFPVLGFAFLLAKPVVSRSSSNTDETESPLFSFKVAGARATAREVGDEFIVLKGPTARKKGLSPESWTSYRSLRDQLIADGKLIEDGEPSLYVFADDVPFTSPSARAAVVNAGNMNGRTAWKLDTGETYQEWYDK
jgi:hypothetical protein